MFTSGSQQAIVEEQLKTKVRRTMKVDGIWTPGNLAFTSSDVRTSCSRPCSTAELRALAKTLSALALSANSRQPVV